MAEKDRITDPTSGSNEPGSETPEQRGKGMPAGTDTQTRLAAASAQKKKEDEERQQDLPIERPGDLPVSEEELEKNRLRNIPPAETP